MEKGGMNDTLFRSEDERAFKQQFVTQFLASWTAMYYAECCARGMQEALEHPPVEDAALYAQKAWEEWCVMMNV
jgi:hypothetical protein